MGMPSIYSITPLQRQNSNPNSSVEHIRRASQAQMVSSNIQVQNNSPEEDHYSGLASHERTAQADRIIGIEANTHLTSIAITDTSNSRVTIFPIERASSAKSSSNSSSTQVAPESSSETSTVISARASLHNHQIAQPYNVKAGIFSPDGQWLATRDLNNILRLGKVENNPSSMRVIGKMANGGQIEYSPDSKWMAWRDPIKGIVCIAVSEGENENRREYDYRGKERFSLSDQYFMLPASYYPIERLQAWEEREIYITALSSQYTEAEIKYDKVTRAHSIAENVTIFFLIVIVTIISIISTYNKEALFTLILPALSIGIMLALSKWQHKLQNKKNIIKKEKDKLIKQTNEEKKIKKIKINLFALQSGIATSEIKLDLHTDGAHPITFYAFSEDKKRLLTIENRHTVKIFCTETGALQKSYEPDFAAPIIHATFSTNKKWLALISFNIKNATYYSVSCSIYFYRIFILSLEDLQIRSRFDLDRIDDNAIYNRSLLLLLNDDYEHFYRFGPLSFSPDDKWLITTEYGYNINSGLLYSIESETFHEIENILSNHKIIKAFYWPLNNNNIL